MSQDSYDPKEKFCSPSPHRVDSSQFQEDISIKKMLQYHHGTLAAKQSCGCYACKVHGNKKGNQRECMFCVSLALYCSV